MVVILEPKAVESTSNRLLSEAGMQNIGTDASPPPPKHRRLPRTELWRLTGTNTKRQKAVMLGEYLFTVGSFNHVQMSSGVQVQGHPGEQLPWGYCEVTFAHSS
jgi:hypothetical protein